MSGTVLVVEDEAELREMMGDALRMSGYNVITASDGQHAFELLATIDDCCIIVLDLLMPRMDGWSFMKKLRTDPQWSRVPVIVHSSSPAHAPATANRVLQKPVELERMLSAVEELCGHSTG